MTTTKVATPIIDKNGKATTVHKNPDKTSTQRAATVAPTASTEDPYRNLHNPEGKLDVTNWIEYKYDYYACDTDHSNDDGGDFCRDKEFGNLRVEEADALTALGKIFNTSEKQIPAELLELGEELGMDDPANYEATQHWGYYGAEARVEISPRIVDELTHWYYQLPNAKDSDGILEYVRQRRTPTAGLTPLEAIKKQLATENGTGRNEYVDKARRVTSAKLNIKSIHVPNQSRLDSVEAESLSKVIKDAICGVVYKRGEDDYVLVDGYHRYKTIKENNKRVGRYIVLS